MESHKTLLMSYLWTKMSGFKTVFPCDNSLSHFFFSSILTKKKRILPQAIGLSDRYSAHLGSNIFNKNQWRAHFYRFQARDVD